MKIKNFIPIGEACSTAMMLNQMNLRHQSLPLDWLASLTPRKLINIFNEDFKNFIPSIEMLNKEYIRKQQLCDNFFHKIDNFLPHPFGAFRNYSGKDPSQVKVLWEKAYKKESKENNLNNFMDFFEEYNFRNFYKGNKREEFIYRNHYKAQCMHDLKMSQTNNGEIILEEYKNLVDTKTKRINNLYNLLKQDNFLAIHISDTFMLDEKYKRWNDLIELSELLKNKFSIFNFKIISLNLLPYETTVNNVSNFSIKWDYWKDSSQMQRDYLKNKIITNY